MLDEGRQLDKRIDDTLNILSFFATHPQEQRIGFDFLEHAQDLAAIQGGRSKGHILHHFHIDAAQTKHDNGAKGAVFTGPQNNLSTGFDHFRHLNPPDDCLGIVGATILDNGLIGVDDFFLILQIQGHATGVTLMQNISGNHFHHHGIANLFSQPHRLIQAARDVALGHG